MLRVRFSAFRQMYSPWHPHHNEDVEHLHHPEDFPCAPSQSTPQCNHCSDFSLHRLLLPVFEVNVSGNRQCVLFSPWLLLLLPVRWIYIVACVSLFLLFVERYSIVLFCLYHSLFIQSPVNRHLVCL